jgi:hypothetical protein
MGERVFRENIIGILWKFCRSFKRKNLGNGISYDGETIGGIMAKKKSKKDPEQKIPIEVAASGTETKEEASEGFGNISSGFIEEGEGDTMSLAPEIVPAYGRSEYICINRKLIIAHTNDNPLLVFKKSPRIMNMLKLARLEFLQRKIDQFVPLIVKKVGPEYRYLGDLETFRAVEKYLEDIGRNDVWCVVVGETFPDSEVSKLWAELNLLNPVPDPLYRIFLYRHHIKKNGFSRKDIKKFLGIGQSNGKEAKKVDRDFLISSSDVLYELVSGVGSEDEDGINSDVSEEKKLASPNPMKSKMTYSQGLVVVDLLGRKTEVHQEFKEKLECWIKEAQVMELESDTVKPMPEREWYVRSKPTEIAMAIAGKKILPQKLKAQELVWSARLIDENNRLLRIPEMTLDLKRKDEVNVRLLFEFYIKANSLVQTVGSYLKTIRPVEHGGSIRGRAAEDDSSLELRSNMSEFYNQRYLKEVFRLCMLKYCNPNGFLSSLGLGIGSFGFESQTKPVSLKYIRQSFSDWKILNHNRLMLPQSLPNVPVDVLSVQNVLKHLSSVIDKHAPSGCEDEFDFETFFHLVFPLVLKEVHKEWNASLALTDMEDDV